jgi:hypothetical protein
MLPDRRVMMCLMISLCAWSADPISISNVDLLPANPQATVPQGFTLTGDVAYGNLSTLLRENTGWGVRLLANKEVDKDGKSAGALQTKVTGITADHGRWFRLRVTGMAQPGFHVERDELYLQVEYFSAQGANALDKVRSSFYAQVEKERVDLQDPGTSKKIGPATWRQYDLEFRTPFTEIDTFVLSAGFEHGKPNG